MKIFEKLKRFHPITGKPVEKWVFKEIRCDFTGNVLDYENHYCTYDLNYHDQDQCFGSDGAEYYLGKDFDIEMFPFLSQTYHFFSIGGTDDCAEREMMEEALKNCANHTSEWHRCYTFDAMCRVARIRTARRLIEEKVIIPEQLNEDN